MILGTFFISNSSISFSMIFGAILWFQILPFHFQGYWGPFFDFPFLHFFFNDIGGYSLISNSSVSFAMILGAIFFISNSTISFSMIFGAILWFPIPPFLFQWYWGPFFDFQFLYFFPWYLGPFWVVPTTTGNIIELMFNSFSWVFFLFLFLFFSSQAKSKYFFNFSLSFMFSLWSVRRAKSIRRQVFFFFFL